MSDAESALASMAPRQDAVEWLSAHVFFDGPIYDEPCDTIIRDVVGPFADDCVSRGWVQRFFFIRYAELGPHVRLRLLGEPDMLERTVKPALVERLHDRSPELATGVRWIPYEPEFDRYGGPHAITIAEGIFHQSSEVALGILGGRGLPSRGARLGQGLLAMLVGFHVFAETMPNVVALADSYRNAYLQATSRSVPEREAWLGDAFDRAYGHQETTLRAYLAEAWRCLEEDESVTVGMDRYRAGLVAACQALRTLQRDGRVLRAGRSFLTWSTCVRAIVPSYVHMMSNRLGVTVSEESYLAHLIQRSLGDPQH